MKLSYQYEETSPKTTVEIHKDATLTEVLDAFLAFTVAVGYSQDNVDEYIADLAKDLGTHLEEKLTYCYRCNVPTGSSAIGPVDVYCTDCGHTKDS